MFEKKFKNLGCVKKKINYLLLLTLFRNDHPTNIF